MMDDAGYFTAIALCFCIPFAITTVRFILVRNSVRDWTPNEYGLIFTQVMQLVLLVMGMVIVMELSDNYPNHEPDFILKVFWAQTFIYILNIWSIKVSVNLLYVRLSNHTNMHKYAIASMWVIGITFIVAFMFQAFSSWPLSCHWEQGNQACPASRQMAVFWTLFSLNIFTDIILFILPFPMIRKIQNRMLQAALAFVFTLGILVVVMSCIRIGLLSSQRDDAIEIIHILSNVQCSIAAIVAVLPGLSSPLMRLLMRYGSAQQSKELNRIPEAQFAGPHVPFPCSEWTNQATYDGSRTRSVADVKGSFVRTKDEEMGMGSIISVKSLRSEDSSEGSSEGSSDNGHRP